MLKQTLWSQTNTLVFHEGSFLGSVQIQYFLYEVSQQQLLLTHRFLKNLQMFCCQMVFEFVKRQSRDKFWFLVALPDRFYR